MNNMLQAYLLGYLNTYFLYDKLRTKSVSPIDYKIEATCNYLGISGNVKKLFSFILKYIIRYIELPISIIIVLYKYILLNVNILFYRKKTNTIRKSLIVLGFNSPISIFTNVLSSIKIPLNQFTVVCNKSNKKIYSKYNNIVIEHYLSYKDLYKSFILSLKTMFYITKKYKKRDCFFRYYSSFEYYLMYIFLKRLDNTNKLFYINLADKWSYLVGSLEIETTFIQHGRVEDTPNIKKIGTVNNAYYINEEQKILCEKYMFKNKPICHYRTNLSFTSNHLLIKDGLPNVLLVANLLFFDKENVIIKELCQRKIHLLVKPHPHDKNLEKYKQLQMLYKFKILEKNDYPKVDYVVSYQSTLADEYNSLGVKVLIYNKDMDISEFTKEINIQLKTIYE